MSKITKGLMMALATTTFLMMTAAVTFAQTTGSVTMNATVSNYVQLTSGGAVTLTGNSGGSVVTNGTADSPLAVVVNLGELGPSNSNGFVRLSAPLRLRSNVAYTLNMVSTVAGAGAGSDALKNTDVGFGMTPTVRAANLAAGPDTYATPGDPTVGGAPDVNGRWDFAGANSDLSSYAVSAAVMNGPRINKAVSANTATSLDVPAIFAIKPQFYDPAASIVITANFTITTP